MEQQLKTHEQEAYLCNGKFIQNSDKLGGTPLNESSFKAPLKIPSSSSLNETKSNLVSILNCDSSEETNIPKSFSVVSSLLKDSFLERAKGSSNPTATGGENPNSVPETSQSTNATSWNHEANSAKDTEYKKDNLSSANTPSDDPNSYLLPRDIDFSEFLGFELAPLPDEAVGKRINDFYIRKNHIRFPMFYTSDFDKLHESRFEDPQEPDNPQWRYNQFILFSTYAGCLLSIRTMMSRSTDQSPAMNPYRYFATAINHAQNCKINDPMKQIHCLVKLIVFLIRQDIGQRLHHACTDKAMQIVAKNNFHKAEYLQTLPEEQKEQHMRYFWSLYFIDRLVAGGRDAIHILQNEDIDLPYYSDVIPEEDEPPNMDPDPNGRHQVNTLSVFLQVTKIIRLESEIIDSIYRVDKTYTEQYAKVEHFLNQIDEWKRNCPKLQGHSQLLIELFYAKASRTLLQPFLGILDPSHPLFIRCMRHCGHIVQGCTEIWHCIKGFNVLSVNFLFVTSLTLIYGLWLASKSTVDYQQIIEDIRLCTCCFYLLAERSPMFIHYRDTIDNLASATIRHVNQMAADKKKNEESSCNCNCEHHKQQNKQPQSNVNIFDSKVKKTCEDAKAAFLEMSNDLSSSKQFLETAPANLRFQFHSKICEEEEMIEKYIMRRRSDFSSSTTQLYMNNTTEKPTGIDSSSSTPAVNAPTTSTIATSAPDTTCVESPIPNIDSNPNPNSNPNPCGSCTTDFDECQRRTDAFLASTMTPALAAQTGFTGSTTAGTICPQFGVSPCPNQQAKMSSGVDSTSSSVPGNFNMISAATAGTPTTSDNSSFAFAQESPPFTNRSTIFDPKESTLSWWTNLEQKLKSQDTGRLPFVSSWIHDLSSNTRQYISNEGCKFHDIHFDKQQQQPESSSSSSSSAPNPASSFSPSQQLKPQDELMNSSFPDIVPIGYQNSSSTPATTSSSSSSNVYESIPSTASSSSSSYDMQSKLNNTNNDTEMVMDDQNDNKQDPSSNNNIKQESTEQQQQPGTRGLNEITAIFMDTSTSDFGWNGGNWLDTIGWTL